MTTLHVWRHPRPRGAVGRCIGGRSELAVDRRKAKRLARRIQRAARRHGLPRAVVTSPLARCAAVGRWLRRWGWRHRVDAALRELDFGAWDGQRWDALPRAAIDAWCADFLRHAPGGGERLEDFLARVRGWAPRDGERVAVVHAGWLCAQDWLAQRRADAPTAASWPAAPHYGAGRVLALGGR